MLGKTMSETFWITLGVAALTALAPTIASVAGLVVALRTKAATEGLHKEINSRMTELTTVTTRADRAEARTEGMESERARAAPAPVVFVVPATSQPAPVAVDPASPAAPLPPTTSER